MAGGWETPPGSALRAMEAQTREMNARANERIAQQANMAADRIDTAGKGSKRSGFSLWGPLEGIWILAKIAAFLLVVVIILGSLNPG